MLAVAVDGDDALRVRKALQHLGKAVLQGPALSLVALVMNHGALRKSLRSCKVRLMILVAAVVDDHDPLKARFAQSVDDAVELLVRVERREHHRAALCTIRFFRHRCSLRCHSAFLSVRYPRPRSPAGCRLSFQSPPGNRWRSRSDRPAAGRKPPRGTR